jgi:hypothetical protein
VRKRRVLFWGFRCARREPVWVNRSFFSIKIKNESPFSAGGHPSLHLSDKELRAAVEAFDANKNGDIEFSEFEQGIALLKDPSKHIAKDVRIDDFFGAWDATCPWGEGYESTLRIVFVPCVPDPLRYPSLRCAGLGCRQGEAGPCHFKAAKDGPAGGEARAAIR